MKISWQVIYLLLYFYRTSVTVIADFFLSKITTLGDNQTYIVGGDFASSLTSNSSALTLGVLIDAPRKFATQLTLALGYYLNSYIGMALIINLVFQTIAFIGIIAVLKALEPQHRKWVLLLLVLPSFTIWSSIAGKEAIVVFAVGIATAYLIKITKKNKLPNIKELLSALLLLIFKAQYLPAFLFIYLTIIFANKIQQKSFLILLVGLISLSFLYIERDRFNYATLEQIPRSFVNLTHKTLVYSGDDGLAGGRSTREVFWEEKNDFIWKSPKGMIIALIGPTYKEALLYNNKLHFFGFIEGMIILVFLIIFITYHSKNASAVLFIAVIFTLFWLLFASYPFGVMNPGTAIRYRTGIIPFIGVLVVYFLSQNIHEKWIRKNRL